MSIEGCMKTNAKIISSLPDILIWEVPYHFAKGGVHAGFQSEKLNKKTRTLYSKILYLEFLF